MPMNEAVREAVRERMKERGVSQAQLGKAVGVERTYINRMLAGKAAGEIPESWEKVFRELGLELYVRPITSK